MREFLFRGKRKDNGEWAYGDLRHWRNGSVGIHNNELSYTLHVDPDTVGQYTGLLDAMGRKIFEGDILHGQFFAVNRQMFVFDDIHVVFHDGAFRFLCGGKDALPPDDVKRISWAIVGNIHESTEKEEPK